MLNILRCAIFGHRWTISETGTPILRKGSCSCGATKLGVVASIDSEDIAVWY